MKIYGMVLLLLVVLLLIALTGAGANEARLRCTADTNVSSYEGERNANYGQSTRLRLKGIQMLALFQFDTAPIAGWKVSKATLHLRYANADRKLRTLGISTISAPWQEGTGVQEAKPGETSFLWRENGKTRWTGPDTDFTDVSYTAGHTIASYADIRMEPGKAGEEGWFTVNVEPKLVQALVAGVSYGLAVSDEKGQTAANNDVYSREQSNSQPYLTVEGSPDKNVIVDALEVNDFAQDTRHAGFGAGAVRFTLTPPRGAFAYNVSVSLPEGQRPPVVPRCQLPLATPEQPQTLLLTGLPPAQWIQVKLEAISASGKPSTPQYFACKTSPAKNEPAVLPRPPIGPPTNAFAPANDALRVWAYPDTEKADPVYGNLLEEAGAARYAISTGPNFRRTNAVWSGQTIRLNGARNEIIGFNLLIDAVKPTLHNVRIERGMLFQDARGKPAWKLQADLFRDWYVKDGNWYPEICVPLTKPFDIPTTDNAVPGQRNQSVFVEFLVPRTVAPGTYHSGITVTSEGNTPLQVPVELVVNNLTLPDTLGFDISLNTYGTVGQYFGMDDHTPEYRALEREYHRMAHRHRSTLAILGYSHTGNISTNYAPPLAGEGANLSVADWQAWDTQFGPYLDGTAFADLPRAGVPITHFYLPFHEAWPGDIRGHYKYKATTTDYPALIAEHALNAPPIAQALDAGFAAGFTNVARQFAEHFKQKNWTRTDFQFYQNDKYYYKDPKTGGRGTSWWLLDEPNHRDDWLALAYFDRLFAVGTRTVKGVSLPMREDISRPQWQRDYLDNNVDLMAVSGELFTKGPRLREMQEQWGVRLWNYGTANAVNRSNTEAEAWAIRAWLAGADAVVPWQTVGSDENYTKAEDTALLLPGKRYGITGPVASLRLKALRRAQQDVEYLLLLAKSRHWDREQVGAALRNLLTTNGAFHKNNADDAGSYQFGTLRAGNFMDVRRGAAMAAK